jgi:hypothetical protein
MSVTMKVNFDDTVENWRLWGQLVELWICDLQPKPTDTGKMVNQMTAHGIKGASIYGPPDREVKFYSYTQDDPLVLMIPTEDELKTGRKAVVAGEAYPLPVFYDGAFTGPRKVLTAGEDTLFSACRVGEYTINFCM